MTETKWIYRWKYWIAPHPTMQGVWRQKGGGYVVRGRVLDPRTGRMKTINRALPYDRPADAFEWLQRELDRIRSGGEDETDRPQTRFADYATSLLERKVALHKIKSAKNQVQWALVLEHHLFPTFGQLYLDRLRRSDIELWQAKTYDRITAGEFSPHTANNWFSILRAILHAAKRDGQLERDPLDGIEPFDTSEYETYSDAEPNALTVDEVPRFLAVLRQRFPQHFAFVALGFATGARPSSLRPLRRHGPDADVDWKAGVLLIRRSHTVGDAVMETTKTGRRQRIALPKELMEILHWHVAQLPTGPMAESALLFPSETGGFRSPTVLDKPFKAVRRELGLTKRVTPRAMRRTFQDLARAAQVHDLVTRAISGHATPEMQAHYSSVAPQEVRDGLARVVSIAGLRDALKPVGFGGGESGGAIGRTTKAG